MLDDLKYIHDRDAQDALGVAEKQWQQLEHQYELPELKSDYQNVVFAGMGGSALYASLTQVWPGLSVPFEICRGYDIPAYAGKDTLFIASSYSGNTEETLEALHQAEAKGVNVAVITGGGKLADTARAKRYPLALLPEIGQPRFATLAGWKALLAVLESAGLTAETDAGNELQSKAPFIREAVTSWLPTLPTEKNQAKQLALEIIGKSPVIYAGPKLAPVAYKWKISFNENAKHVAWCGTYPEFNHNEFIGWSAQPVDKPYTVIDLRSSFENERIQKRFEVSERLLSGKRPAPEVVTPEGQSLLEHMLWTIALGDFTSLYTALLNGLNPTPVNLIERLKTELAA